MEFKKSSIPIRKFREKPYKQKPYNQEDGISGFYDKVEEVSKGSKDNEK